MLFIPAANSRETFGNNNCANNTRNNNENVVVLLLKILFIGIIKKDDWFQFDTFSCRAVIY